jgi:DNA-binding MarR family transcriptional regulator
MPKVEPQIIRQLLDAIDTDEGISQRSLALQLDISVGSVNWYLKRCFTKGLIKFKQAPVKRYLYYLTPKGFQEKATLTASYIRVSLSFFREGRAVCNEFFVASEKAGRKYVALAGDGELAEIAVLSALENNCELMAVIDPRNERPTCAGVRVAPSLQALVERSGGTVPQAILLTELNDPHGIYELVSEQLGGFGLSRDLIHFAHSIDFISPDQGETLS